MKTIRTIDIMEFIQENGAGNLPLKFKNKKGEIFSYQNHYVVDEVYYLIANNESENNCATYLRGIDYEATDKCWNDNIDEKDLANCYEDDLEELYALRRAVVMNLDTLLYIGDFNVFNNAVSFEIMKSIEILNNTVLISF